MRPASVGFHCPDDVSDARQTVRAKRTTVGALLLDAPPYLTVSIIVLNVAAYLVTGTSSGGSLSNPTRGALHPDSLFYHWQLSPYLIHQNGWYYELITSAFLHVSVLHIASNMLTLFFVGPVLERQLGRWRFLAVYVLSALGGSAAIYAFGDQFGTTVGASGAIYGLLGVCLVLARKLGLDLQWLIGIVAINFVLTFSISSISKLGHVGGFITGLLAGLAIGGLPAARARLSLQTQLSALGGLLALIAVVVALRSATY
jgi:membrane associated rhomboid family serine protease